MESFSEVYEDTKGKLGRQLQEKEKEFLHWVYESYEKERQKNGEQCKSLQKHGV